MLSQAKSSPDINNYLTYLFSTSQPPEGLSYTAEDYYAVRSAAAIMLKNNIRTGYRAIPESSLAFIRTSIPLGLQDKNPQIRNVAGNVITEIIRSGGLLGWPQLLPELLDLIRIERSSHTLNTYMVVESLRSIFRICQDQF